VNIRRLTGILWVVAGLVLLFAAFRDAPRNNAYLLLGVLCTILGAARLRRSRPA
jgi:hypothetical protein